MTTRGRAWLALALVVAAAPRLAEAAPDLNEARIHYERAHAYIRANQPILARQEFEEAFRCSGHPNMLENIGEVSRNLALRVTGTVDDAERAIDAFQRFLALDPGSAQRPQIERWLEELKARRAALAAREARLAGQHGGDAVGPRDRGRPRGSRTGKQGNAEATAPPPVHGPAPEGATATSPPRSDTELGTPPPTQPTEPAVVAASPTPASGSGKPGWLRGAEVGLGVAIGLGLAGAGWGVYALASDGTPACHPAAGARCPAVVDGRDAGIVAVSVGGGVALVAAVTLIALEVRARPAESRAPSVTLAPLWVPGGGGAALAGRF